MGDKSHTPGISETLYSVGGGRRVWRAVVFPDGPAQEQTADRDTDSPHIRRGRPLIDIVIEREGYQKSVH